MLSNKGPRVSDADITKPSALPLPPVGTAFRDPQGVEWKVTEHEDGRARLASVVDPDLRRLATAERLSGFELVRRVR